MPDLSREAAAQYWADYIDPMIYRIVTFMESVEDWTLDDHASLEQSLTSLGTLLDEIEQVDLATLGHEKTFIELVANIKSGRGLRVLQALNTSHPGSAPRILGYAEEITASPDDSAALFLRRNIIFERLRLLSRVFSEYRVKLVAKALEGDE